MTDLFQTLDKHQIDQHGHRLLERYQSNDLCICNGRIGEDRYEGKFTCTTNSVINHIICTPYLTAQMEYFEVLEYDPMLSDVHCCIRATLLVSDCPSVAEQYEDKAIDAKDYVYWDENKAGQFSDSISELAVSELEKEMHSNTNVDALCKQISNIFLKSAEKTGMIRKKRGQNI